LILVDTSIWIDFFNKEKSTQAKKLEALIEQEESICLVDLILTEILQGIKDDILFEKTRDHLLNFPIFKAKSLDTYIYAADIYRLCRKKGLSIRKTIDSLIASIALENNLEIFHNDRDFDNIALCTRLKIFEWNK